MLGWHVSLMNEWTLWKNLQWTCEGVKEGFFFSFCFLLIKEDLRHLYGFSFFSSGKGKHIWIEEDVRSSTKPGWDFVLTVPAVVLIPHVGLSIARQFRSPPTIAQSGSPFVSCPRQPSLVSSPQREENGILLFPISMFFMCSEMIGNGSLSFFADSFQALRYNSTHCHLGRICAF